MRFEEWDDQDWKVEVRELKDKKEYVLKAPGVNYIFTKNDFLQLTHNINAIAEHIYDKEFYYIHDNDIFLRTGGQLLGVIGDCEELNRLHKENQKLIQRINELEKKEYEKDD